MLNYFSLNHFSPLHLIVLAIFSIISGPVGVLTSWLRISFLIDVLSHSAIFGIGLHKYFQIDKSTVLLVSNMSIAIILSCVHRKNEVLAAFSQISMAIGMIMMFYAGADVDHIHYLCGHLHGISMIDLILVTLSVFLITILLCFYKKGLFLTLLSEDLAIVSGHNVKFIKFFSLICIVFLVTESTKLAGVLSSSAMFLIPPLFVIGSVSTCMIISSIISILSIAMTVLIVEVYHLPLGPTSVISVLLTSIIYKTLFTIVKISKK